MVQTQDNLGAESVELVINAGGPITEPTTTEVQLFKVLIKNRSGLKVLAGGKFGATNQDTNELYEATLPEIPNGQDWNGSYNFQTGLPDKWLFSAKSEDPDFSWMGLGIRQRPQVFSSVELTLVNEH
ncbi:hypothetical protein H6G17_25705 [Chroococcidiopsis sp. FACHB-1243]|uniref:hypothetical protein n=1 Tax=Chroococcidiopsis sp. [FACHB-1243] TaxID=2692781 RepID=UPI0017847D30|nr:hypothetical protein [Chroococcidiopsis sp. [FACHB-1243]]MBD2308867.1 hypothetical protein [Chroococcidiopsis sp. [FACHB-1243]]